MTANKSQVDRIIEIIERTGRVDNFRCIHERISLRLGARIWDLRQRGWEFRTEERPDKNTVYHVTATPTVRVANVTYAQHQATTDQPGRTVTLSLL